MKKNASVLLLVLLVVFSGTISAKTVTLHYWTHVASTAIDANKALIKEFEDENPGIKVVYEAVGTSGDLLTKLVTSFVGGGGPDVFWLPDWDAPRFIELGMAAPYPGDFREIEDLYEPGSLEAFKADNRLYTTGLSEYNTLSLIYNREVFQEAGIPEPSAVEPMTVEEFLAIGERLTKYDGKRRLRSGFEFMRPPLGPSNWTGLMGEPWVRQLGGEFIDSKTGLPLFDSEPVVKVFQFMQDLELNYKISDVSFVINVLDDFAQGRVAMFVGGAWAPPIFKSLNPEIEIGIAPLPVFADGKRTTVLYSYGWMVNTNSAHQEEAWELARFLATSDPDFWWNSCGYIQPVRGQLAKLRAEDPAGLGAFVEDFHYGNYLFRSAYFQELIGILSRAQSTIMSEKVNVQTVLEKAQKEALQVMEKE